MGMNLIGSSSSLMSGVADAVDEVDKWGYDIHTVEVVADNGAWRVRIDSTDEDMEDIRHEVWLNHYGARNSNVDEVDVR